MSAWDDVRKAIDAGDREQTVRVVTALDEPGRREVAKELPGALKAMRPGSRFGFPGWEAQEPLLLAGAGTIGGPAAAAAWLCRRELRLWWAEDGFAGLCAALCAVTAGRPDAWRAEVGRRVAARLRVSGDTWFLWHLSAALTRSAGAPPPESDGFVAGWAAEGGRPGELAGDPFLDPLLPRLFEVDGVGALLAEDATRTDEATWNGRTWIGALVSLARDGRIERELLLDGCVGRFLRGGRPHELRWFVRLHNGLEPTADEAAARVRDYVRLLPVAPSTVADLALRTVRQADDLGALDAALFEEAVGALLFRPERKFLRGALTWLDRTARKRDRVEATVTALTAVFGSEALDLRERAVKIAVKHAARAGEPARAEVRDAAAVLPAELRAAIAEAFGGAAAPAEPEPVPEPPPFVPREWSAPIGSLAELAEEFTVHMRAAQEWRSVERFLAALVEFAYADSAAVREALRGPVADIAPWLAAPKVDRHTRVWIGNGWVQSAVRSLFAPDPGRSLGSRLRSAFQSWDEEPAGTRIPLMERFLLWRMREIGSALGRVPLLLATPTEGGGHVAPDVLLDRLERLAEAGAEPARSDLLQALLRLPRETDPSAAARAKALTSKAGRTAASWLARGGLGDPAVECELGKADPAPGGRRRVVADRLAIRVSSTPDTTADPDIAYLCTLPEGNRTYFPPLRFDGLGGFWPSVLPSHREVTAAHLLPHIAATADYDWGLGPVMHDLAEADGPAGPATAALLALALTSPHDRVGADAVGAFLVLSAQGALPAAETGTALGRLAVLDGVPLPRIVRALTEAADAGAGAGVWATLAAALPHLLPGPGESAAAGAPALLTLATRAAETTGAKGTIPAVADVAARGGSTRLVTEAARLHRTLAT
ncbi:DUF6493 family protein [Actinomadura livida]|uniref:Secreted protein n=1 Tax=Actinomadura livida TaxID=79909 RepID=A0A7W7IC62_9ACTN|nr:MULTISPECIES: DUF6493 family protein [Actinomadura]MBB4774301.1 hypothetical protein [Actinomadura catellatispora]GGT83559.1 hypothetical protein GCM10010208_02490 [Actinomadura livida]